MRCLKHLKLPYKLPLSKKKKKMAHLLCEDAHCFWMSFSLSGSTRHRRGERECWVNSSLPLLTIPCGVITVS